MRQRSRSRLVGAAVGACFLLAVPGSGQVAAIGTPHATGDGSPARAADAGGAAIFAAPAGLTGDVALADAASGRRAVAAPDASSWARWQGVWARLDSIEISARTLSGLAGLDAARAALLDSLCDAAGLSRGASADDPASGTIADSAFPVGVETIAWARRAILDGLFLGEPKPARLLIEEWDPLNSREWNDDGLFTLPAAVLLAARGNPERALSWLEGAPVPADDEPYAAVLGADCRAATGDTAGAALVAQARLARVPPLPSWAREPLEEMVIRGTLASADTAQARRLLDALPSARDRRAFVLPMLRRLASLRGEAHAADSLVWLAAREFPGGRTAERLLRDVVSPEGRVDPAVGGRAEQVRILLAAAESRGDAARFRALAGTFAPSPGTARADSVAIRAARTAWKARDYEGLVQRAAESVWRAGGPFADEWELITARALRNGGRIDSMADRYERVARRGSPEDRRTAFWEWAREMEAQRRFVEADSLYGRFVAAGAGDQRAQALLRRGICRVARGAPQRARAVLEEAAAVGTAEERAAAWFWIYRAELARGRRLEARAALAKAADTRAGYYAQRARSGLFLAREPGGPPVDDPEAYWRAVSLLGGDGTEIPAPGAADGDGAATDDDGERGATADDGAGVAHTDSAPGSDAAIRSSTVRAAVLATDSAFVPPGTDSLRSGRTDEALVEGRRAAWTAPISVRAACDRLQLFRLTGRTEWATMAREDLLAEPGLGAGPSRVRHLLDLRLPDLAARAAGNLGSTSARLRHPFPHAPAVAAASRRFGIAPEWAWAVMRRESLYESAVVSPAGAVGLMQLVASTAKETAQRHGISAGPLEAPRVNILLGMAHLGDLAAAARGNWPFVLAAYNAGTVPAQRWLRSGEDPDIYIEMIGYRETRDYARRVLETFWTCRELLRGTP
jgi:tetratricopeptide (TPR) repeat protein